MSNLSKTNLSKLVKTDLDFALALTSSWPWPDRISWLPTNSVDAGLTFFDELTFDQLALHHSWTTADWPVKIGEAMFEPNSVVQSQTFDVGVVLRRRDGVGPVLSAWARDRGRRLGSAEQLELLDHLVELLHRVGILTPKVWREILKANDGIRSIDFS